MPFAHPLVDRLEDGVAISETRGPLLALTPTRVDLLVSAGRARVPVALLTGELTRLTEALRLALIDTRARWLVRGPSGLRDGLTGLEVTGPAAVPVPEQGRLAEDALLLERPAALQLVASLSVRHRPDATTLLGGAIAALGAAAGVPPTRWGADEPLAHDWHRAALTALARGRMPAETRLLVGGSDGDRAVMATLTARRTRFGVEEITEACLALGRPTDAGSDARADRAVAALGALGEDRSILVGLLFTRAGPSDLTAAPFATPVPVPLAVFVGARAVRALGIEPAGWIDRLGARAVGTPRAPGLLVPLRRSAEPPDIGWRALRRVVDEIGRDRVERLAGLRLDPRVWDRL